MCILCQVATTGAAALMSIIPAVGTDSPTVTKDATSYEAPTAVAKCTKIGSTRVVKKVTQKCSRVGKTLQWVNSKSVTTTPSSLPTTSSGTSGLPNEGSECTAKGDQKTFAGGRMECRKISTGKLQWFKLSDSPSAPVQAAGNVDSSQCQLTDQRPVRNQPYAVGFPKSQEDTRTSGTLRLVLVAIDFQDAAGTDEELASAQKQIDRFNEYLRFESGGKLSATWEFQKSWSRMPRVSTGYPIVFGSSSGDDQFMNDMISVSDTRTNFSGNDFVFILIPKSAKDFPSPEGFYANYQTAEGRIQKYFAGGKFFYENDATYKPRELWSVWLHEMGHTFGLAGHAPFATSLNIMENQDGFSKTMSAWDKFLMNWMPSGGVYCRPSSTLGTVDVQLVPMQRLTAGFRSIMIPLTASKLIVVESHRAEGFGDRLSKGTYGVMAYVVDTTLDNDRSGENVGQGRTRFASLLIPSNSSSRGLSDEVFSRGGTGILDSLMLQGESVSFGGVSIAFVSSGDYDTIRISK